MQYFVLPIALICLCEMFGQVITNKYSIQHGLCFTSILGFGVLLGLYYVICFPLVIFNSSFKIVFFTTLIYFIAVNIYIYISKENKNKQQS